MKSVSTTYFIHCKSLMIITQKHIKKVNVYKLHIHFKTDNSNHNKYLNMLKTQIIIKYLNMPNT